MAPGPPAATITESMAGPSISADAPAEGRVALVRALASPELYPGHPPVEVRETHASWVFLAGDHAYKVKKPVQLAFLDYSSLAARRAACHEEVRVNRALAPSIYRGVVAIVRDREGTLRYAEEDAPGAVEYAVKMHRFDETATLQGAIDAHTLSSAAIRATAVRIADFHRGAARLAAPEPATMLAAWRKNLAEIERLEHPPTWRLAAMGACAEAFAAAHGQELVHRSRAGYIRDCHGDLRCEHILLGRSIRIVDRVEFDPALRRMDVARDLAFLAMDLEAQGRRQAARELVSAYRHAGGRPGSAPLRAFYGAYWALVRAKVALVAAAEHTGTARRRERTRAARLWRLAERLCWRARLPLAIVVCGPPASGKSTLAAALKRASGLPVVSSDALRKRRAGLAPTARLGPAHYTQAASLATYELLCREALTLLERSEGVIVDASCVVRRERAILFDGLRATPARLLVVRCQVPLATALARACARTGAPLRVSDATPAVAAARAREFEPLDELPTRSVLALDAEAELGAQLAAVASAVDERACAPCFPTASPGVNPEAGATAHA